MSLPIQSDKAYLLAVEELTMHVNGKEIFNGQKPNVGIGIIISEDLSKKMYRQAYYKTCTFDKAILKSIGFAGSKFIDTIFQDCVFSNGNFHSCDFNKVHIIGTSDNQLKVENAGFHKSTFSNCGFRNLSLFSCGFTDTVFYNTVFDNCKIRLCSLENAQFINCHFINTDCSNVNLEYVEFKDLRASDTVFPFPTVSKAYGLLQNITELSVNNYIYTASRDNNKLSINEYLTLLPAFEKYYLKRQEYFPLINIYIYMQKIDLAYEAIAAGILQSVKLRDYRSLKYYCKLVYLNHIFTYKQRRQLYENISRWILQEKLSLSEYHTYQISISTLREFLLEDDYDELTLYFNIETNIEPYEKEKQVILLSTLESILEECNIASNSIELRHHSAYIDFLTVTCQNLEQFSNTLILLYSSLAGITLFMTGFKKVVETAQTITLKRDEHKLNTLEIHKKETELDYYKKKEELDYQKGLLEYQKLVLEYEELQKHSKSYREILLDHDIRLTVSHDSKNLKSVPFPEVLKYNSQ